MPVSIQLDNKVALVTGLTLGFLLCLKQFLPFAGAGGAIGREIACRLAEAGAKVALSDVNEESVCSSCQHIQSKGDCYGNHLGSNSSEALPRKVSL